jgi:hypothetical protein
VNKSINSFILAYKQHKMQNQFYYCSSFFQADCNALFLEVAVEYCVRGS